MLVCRVKGIGCLLLVMDGFLSGPGHGGGVGGCLHSRTWCWGRGRRRLWMLVSGYGGFMTQGN